MSKLIDLIRQKFGRLEVIQRMDNDQHRNSKWLCKCSCGNKVIIPGYSLKNGDTKSCGCLRKEKIKQRFTIHGHRKNRKRTGFYKSWQAMIQRCTNSNDKDYHNYGGRGITVCKSWFKFLNFEEDMIKHWKPGLTLERRNNKKEYFPENCYWATKKEQARNKRNNYLIPCFGKLQCISTWSEETGIPRQVISWRINHGWPSKQALTKLVRKYKKRKEK